MKQYDVIVVGGGAAGLMCALTAGQRGRRVVVLERANKVGKKILMSGGGRCNFTNLYAEPDCFLSDNPHFCKSALSRYTPGDFIELVERHGVAYHEKTLGQLFCNGSSKEILAMLLQECSDAGVDILTNCDVHSVKKDERFVVRTNMDEFVAESLVVASGGLSIPTLGGSGFGYEVAQQFGLALLPRRAALVPFTFTDGFKMLSEKLSGISVDSVVRCNGVAFRENILFTHRGLSGPAILQVSSYWREGQSVWIDLLPDLNVEEWLLKVKQSRPKQRLRTLLSQYLPKNLVQQLEQMWWSASTEAPIGEISNKKLQALSTNLKNWRLKPSGTEGYRTAEVTLGGVDTNGLSSKTMESKNHPGLYFIGEVVDVTGHLGGFNFQWAWASGYVSGLNV